MPNDDSPRDGEDVRMADLVDDPSDIPRLREHYKAMAKNARDQGDDASVGDFLAQSRKNDAAYITPSDMEKAEWIAEIYEQEDSPEIHPRDFHYRILGKGYERRNGDQYENSNACWNELKEAFKWARILGLIESEQINDETNTDVEPTAFDNVDRPLPEAGIETTREAAESIEVDDGYRHATIPSNIELAELLFDDVDEFIATAAKMVSDQAFQQIYFDESSQQRYYIEIWSEKSGVIPTEVAGEYGATIREAGTGEFSLSMCEEAVEIAAKRNQDLAIVIVSDFDPKGSDMPISAGRKFEVVGALNDVEVELVHGAVTKDQVEQYGIPGDPAKVPDNLEHGVAGAKGYETQKEMFREYAGQFPVEIQAFTTRFPDEFESEIAERLESYYDVELGDEIKESVMDAREEARRALVDAFEEREDELSDALDELHGAVDSYHDRLESHVEATIQGVERFKDLEKDVRQDEEIPETRNRLTEIVAETDHQEILAQVDVDLPDPGVAGVEDPLLDTRRSLLEQLAAYRRSNIRYDD